MTAPDKQPFQSRAGVLMIVHQQNSESACLHRSDLRLLFALLRRRNCAHCQNKGGTAIASLAFGNQRAAMRLRQRFGNGQSQTKSTKTPLERAVALLEWIKN